MSRAAYMDIGDAPAQFRLAALAAAGLPADLRKRLATSTRTEVLPAAVRLYAQAPGATSTGNRLPFVTIRRPSVTSRQGVITGLKFGGTRRLKGGARVVDLVRPVEFGSTGKDYAQYTRRAPNGGASHTVKRRTAQAFTPRRSNGRVIWPTTYDRVAPMMLAAWTRAVFDLVDEVSS